jgi:cationic amino acid transporter 14
MYSYVAVGEFLAFITGWNIILEYMIGSAAGASALSACLDALVNHSMSAYLEEHVGTVIGREHGGLHL